MEKNEGGVGGKGFWAVLMFEDSLRHCLQECKYVKL